VTLDVDEVVIRVHASKETRSRQSTVVRYCPLGVSYSERVDDEFRESLLCCIPLDGAVCPCRSADGTLGNAGCSWRDIECLLHGVWCPLYSARSASSETGSAFSGAECPLPSFSSPLRGTGSPLGYAASLPPEC
jgi:hypothetical protein